MTLSNEIGRRIACYLGRKRMSRHFDRTFYRAFDAWKTAEELVPGSGTFDIATLLDDLNDVNQQDIEYLNRMIMEIGCIDTQSSYEDTTIYVDPVAGSDITGDGGSASPYASLEFLTSGIFPRYINHAYRILILSDLTTDNLCLDQVIGPNGSLSIIGVSAPTVVNTSIGTGPFAITNINTYGSQYHAYEFLTTTPTDFIADELYGNWIRFTTGDCAGECLPVHSNGVNSIWTRTGWSVVPSIGDQFEIIEPSITLNCQTINLALSGPKNVKHTTVEGSRFNLINMKIDVAGIDNASDHFVLQNNLLSQISFVTLIYASGISNWCKIESDLNQNRSTDTGIAALSEADINNLDMGNEFYQTCSGLLIYRTTTPDGSANEFQISKLARYVSAIDCRGRAYVTAHMETITRCGFGRIFADHGATCSLALCLISGYPTGSLLYLYSCGQWTVDVSHFDNGLDIFQLNFGKLRVVAPSNVTKGTITGHGVRFDRGNAQMAVNANPFTWTGVAGAIYFGGGVGTVAFPAADRIQTDSLGNIFARIDTL